MVENREEENLLNRVADWEEREEMGKGMLRGVEIRLLAASLVGAWGGNLLEVAAEQIWERLQRDGDQVEVVLV